MIAHRVVGRWPTVADRLPVWWLGLLLFAAGAVHAGGEGPASARLVAFVERAAALIEAEGEAAFPRFRLPDSEWYRGDRYLFVWGLDGVRHVYPPDPAGEGRNLRDLTDAGGRPIGERFIAKAAGPTGRGWVHYQWPRPGELFPAWKSSYLQRATAPSGNAYLVGAGVYGMALERPFVAELVASAARLLAAEGRAAYERLRDPAGEFRFMDAYVFVFGVDGVERFNPAFPSLEGRNLLDYRDKAGKPLIREMIGRSAAGEGAWVEYQWPKPGEAEPARKVAYVKRVRVDGEELVVGAGFYEE